MPTTLKLKNSVTAAAAPSTLVQGEAAVNVTDKKVWVGNAASSPVQILGAGATIAGTTATLSSLTSGRVTYASTGGLLADSANLTFNGTTLTTANDASISGLTVGKGGGAVSTNTAVGASALSGSNSGSGQNTAIGGNSLASNTTGVNNVGVGYLAGQANTTGQANIMIGSATGYNNTASWNTAIGGGNTFYANTSGTNNTAVGGGDGTNDPTMRRNTTGSNNTALGVCALASNTTASNNTAVGYQAGYSNTTGSPVDSFGYQAGYSNTTGVYNASFGYQAGKTNTTGLFNCAFGANALLTNSGTTANNAFGVSALEKNTTGNYNCAFGKDALYSNTTASNNTAVGYQAGYSNTTGNSNAFFGYQAGYASTDNNQTAIGYRALYASTGAYYQNTAVGSNAGLALTTGYNCTFIGQNAGSAITTGANNTILGRYTGNQGGLDIRTASNYIVLSDGDGNPRFFFNSADAYLNTVTQRNSGQLSLDYNGTARGGIGINDTASANASAFIGFLTGGTFRGSISNNNNTAVAYNTTSDYRLKENIAPMTGALSKVAQLKPCTYTWKETGEQSQGFIAHELAEVCPDAVTGEKDAVDSEGNPKYQGVDTSFLVATLTAAIQELKAEFDVYKASHP